MNSRLERAGKNSRQTGDGQSREAYYLLTRHTIVWHPRSRIGLRKFRLIMHGELPIVDAKCQRSVVGVLNPSDDLSRWLAVERRDR